MNDFRIQKEKAKEKMFEAILEYAGACHAENIANEMQEDEPDEQIPFPSELDIRIRKLIARHNRKESIKRIWKTTAKVFPKVAAIFCAAFISFTILITSVEAFRVKVLNFIIDVSKEYTNIDVENNNSSEIPSDWENIYIPEYVPEGFKISTTQKLAFSKIIVYKNNVGQSIIYTQSIGGKRNIRIDTEDAATEKILINENEGLLAEKNGRITIVWHNNDACFSLISEADKNELIKMAESIKIRK